MQELRKGEAEVSRGRGARSERRQFFFYFSRKTTFSIALREVKEKRFTEEGTDFPKKKRRAVHFLWGKV